MKNVLITWALNLLWLAVGKLGKDLLRWIDDAQLEGLEGRNAFDYVWSKAKVSYHDIGDWLLNLIIEATLGKKAIMEKKLKKKLKWPKKLKINW